MVLLCSRQQSHTHVDAGGKLVLPRQEVVLEFFEHLYCGKLSDAFAMLRKDRAALSLGIYSTSGGLLFWIGRTRAPVHACECALPCRTPSLKLPHLSQGWV